MAQYKIGSASTSNMTDNVEAVQVDARLPEGTDGQKETTYNNPDFSTYFGYYKEVPEVKAATDTISRWVVGDGYIAPDAETEVILDHISGWGIDTFDDILENMDRMSRINGDAFAEIIREDGILVNLKVLDPSTIDIVVDPKGKILRYEQKSKIKGSKKVFSPEEIFHLSNNRIADEIHGTSDYESVEDIINALNESFQDMKTLVHRNVVPLRIVKVDTDDTAKIAALTTKYETMIKNKEVLFVPKDTIEIETQGLSNNATYNPMPWRESLKNQFYQLIGLPQILMGSASEFSESSAKIAYLSFEQTIKQRQRYIITQVWNQLYLKIDMAFPTTLQNEMLSDQKKDGQNQQMNFQPSDITAGVGK